MCQYGLFHAFAFSLRLSFKLNELKVKLNEVKKKMFIWNLGIKNGMKSRTECVETRTEETYVSLEKQTCQN